MVPRPTTASFFAATCYSVPTYWDILRGHIVDTGNETFFFGCLISLLNVRLSRLRLGQTPAEAVSGCGSSDTTGRDSTPREISTHCNLCYSPAASSDSCGVISL